MLEDPTIIECLDQALELYREAEEKTQKKVSFNIAKCLYEKVQWILNSTFNKDSNFIP